MKTIMHVVGARPNFMKTAPIMREMAKYPREFRQVLVHTGQHYDKEMSGVFFKHLGMPKPDVNLNIGSGSHAAQTARIMLAFEPVVLKYKPDWVMIVGDVNSTMACALVCVKLGVKVAHVEAGLRSFDPTMPEEWNRLVTDRISDLLLTPSRDADRNLLKEGVPSSRIRFVGNVMIDTLVKLLPVAKKAKHTGQYVLGRGPDAKNFILVTLHRPCNVDSPPALREIMSALEKLAMDYLVVFPVHPRTRKALETMGLAGHGSAGTDTDGKKKSGIVLLSPLGYLDFLALQTRADLVITDSGGIQEETTYLGVPCLTIRPNTERPITITHGTNKLVAANKAAIVKGAEDRLGSKRHGRKTLPLWDGKAAKRIVQVLRRIA